MRILKMMKFIIPLLLICSSAFAASGSGNVSNVVSIGGVSIPNTNASITSLAPALTIPAGDVGTYKTLFSSPTNQGAVIDYYYHFLDGITSTQYQVPTGKSFYVIQIIAVTTSMSQQFSFNLGTATAPFTDSNATVPTGAIYLAHGASARYVFFGGTATGGTAAPAQDKMMGSSWNIPFKFDQNLYPFLHNYIGSGQMVYLIGIEK